MLQLLFTVCDSITDKRIKSCLVTQIIWSNALPLEMSKLSLSLLVNC